MSASVAEFIFSNMAHRYLTDKKYKGRRPKTDKAFTLIYVNKQPYALKLHLSRSNGVGSICFYVHWPENIKVDGDTHTFMPGNWTTCILWKGLYGKRKFKMSNGGWLWIKVKKEAQEAVPKKTEKMKEPT